MKRRRIYLLALSSGPFLVFLYYVLYDHHEYLSTIASKDHRRFGQSIYSSSTSDEWDPSHWLQGNKTNRSKDNLKTDVFYITSGACSGFTNLVIGYFNMLYLASITDRVPIIPPFFPNGHITPPNPPITFSEVFDLPRLRSSLHMPILEWQDVKDLRSGKHVPPVKDDLDSEPEAIGCWSSWLNSDAPAKWSLDENFLNLDISYTRVDDRYRKNGREVVLFSLASSIYPNAPTTTYPIWTKSDRTGHSLPPDQHLVCFDDLYFSTTNILDSQEWFGEFNPAWRMIGRHAHFAPKLMDSALGYVRRTLDLSMKEVIPPFIAVHVRHGDFGNGLCTEEQLSHKECFHSIDLYAKKVREVQEELRETRGTEVKRVILASDEKDPSFWNSVLELGWSFTNHTAAQTTAKCGNDWYEVFLDTAILSMGVGFVGTGESTFSVLAGKRARAWNDAVVRMVPRTQHG